MNDESTTNTNGDNASLLEPGTRYYLFLGFAGLIVFWLVLMDMFDLFALAPALVGAAGLATFLVPPGVRFLRKPMYVAPILVLMLVVVFASLFDTLATSSVGLDLLAATALLAYLGAQYRLFGLGAAAVPVDSRPRLDRPDGDLPESRSPSQVAPREPLRLLIVIAICVVAGQLMWRFVVAEGADTVVGRPRLGMREGVWRMASLIWLVGVGTLLAMGFLRILRAYRMSGDEAALIGVNTLWAETRGEQRRLARWHAWRRRKSERRLEKQP